SSLLLNGSIKQTCSKTKIKTVHEARVEVQRNIKIIELELTGLEHGNQCLTDELFQTISAHFNAIKAIDTNPLFKSLKNEILKQTDPLLERFGTIFARGL
ncbi:MAG: hypothetical protein P4L31_08370, partial [Candidatus Babeliales bacterium]|nr:hypothetical protein [Candidatus Babeliales bacterium]